MDEPSVGELVEAFDAMHCPQCQTLRTEIETLMAGPPDDDREIEALHRWQRHKDDEHPLLADYLRRQDP
jgi:hypothetical protein